MMNAKFVAMLAAGILISGCASYDQSKANYYGSTTNPDTTFVDPNNPISTLPYTPPSPGMMPYAATGKISGVVESIDYSNALTESGSSGSSGQSEAYGGPAQPLNRIAEIRVRLDDGSVQTYHQSDRIDFRTGSRVQVTNGHVDPDMPR